jgi:hypothetical protein
MTARPGIGLAALIVAFATATPASSDSMQGGIRVTASKVEAAFVQSDRSSRLSIYTLVASARWSPDALRTEGTITIKNLADGATQRISFGTGGSELHSTETHRGFFGAAAGARYLLSATWRVYTPGSAGTVEGRATSSPATLHVPDPEPAQRLRDAHKQRLAAKAKRYYQGCAAFMVSAAALAASGVAVPLAFAMTAVAGLTCGSALTLDYLSRDPIDPRFRAIAAPTSPTPPRISPGDGLSAAGATLLNALVSLQAREMGLARAILTAFNRSQGAHVKQQTEWERKQMRAAGRYAAQLSGAMLAEAKLRLRLKAALAGSALEEAVGLEAAYAFQDSVVREDVPDSLVAVLAKIGLTRVEQSEVRAQLLAIDPSFYRGSALDALASPSLITSLKSAAADLRAFSKRAARDPLATAR